mgnify:FL=1
MHPSACAKPSGHEPAISRRELFARAANLAVPAVALVVADREGWLDWLKRMIVPGYVRPFPSPTKRVPTTGDGEVFRG